MGLILDLMQYVIGREYDFPRRLSISIYGENGLTYWNSKGVPAWLRRLPLEDSLGVGLQEVSLWSCSQTSVAFQEAFRGKGPALNSIEDHEPMERLPHPP